MNDSAPYKSVIVVLGMHRSGTSIGMNVLSSLGVACGEDLIPAGRSNTEGFWEHAEIVAVQDGLLTRLDRLWHGSHGTFPMPKGWLDSDAAKQAEDKLAEIVTREIASHPDKVWGFKDPRTIKLWPLWQRIWGKLQINPFPIAMIRHPDAVVRSLAKHNGVSTERALLIWAQHNVEILRHLGDDLRLVIDFDLLVNEPAAQIERIAQALEDVVEITPDARAAAASKVLPEMRTHDAIPEAPGNLVAASVYGALRSYATGHNDTATITDAIALYDGAEALFANWRDGRSNVLTDWLVRFVVSRLKT
ncbi:MAG: sulfotransferase [Pseudomonadota bacterium]